MSVPANETVLAVSGLGKTYAQPVLAAAQLEGDIAEHGLGVGLAQAANG